MEKSKANQKQATGTRARSLLQNKTIATEMAHVVLQFSPSLFLDFLCSEEEELFPPDEELPFVVYSAVSAFTRKDIPRI